MSHATRVGTCRRIKQAAVLTTVALATAGLGAAAPANAQSLPTTYACSTPLGAANMPVVIDTDLPATMAIGQSRPISLISKVTTPNSAFSLAYSALGARFAEGTAVANGQISGPSGTTATVTNLVVKKTAVPASGDMLVTSSGAGSVFRPTRLGTYTVTAGDFVSKLNFLNDAGTVVFPDAEIRCTAPATGDRTVDRVTVTKAASSSSSSAKVAKKARRVTVRSAVAGQYGNDPSGTVTFVIKKGKKKVARVTEPLNAANLARTKIKKRLAKGRYVLTTTYAGNAALTPSRDVVRFRVR